MSYTPETIGENLRVWKDKVGRTAHYLLGDGISSADKARELVRYAIVSESLIFGHIGIGALWLGYNTYYIVNDSCEAFRSIVIDAKQDRDEINDYLSSLSVYSFGH